MGFFNEDLSQFSGTGVVPDYLEPGSDEYNMWQDEANEVEPSYLEQFGDYLDNTSGPVITADAIKGTLGAGAAIASYFPAARAVKWVSKTPFVQNIWKSWTAPQKISNKVRVDPVRYQPDMIKHNSKYKGDIWKKVGETPDMFDKINH